MDDFCVQMQKVARVIGADERTTVYATLSDLMPIDLTYVTQAKPATMTELLEAARVAELTLQPDSNDGWSVEPDK